jgi:hypothetical protein
MQKQIPKNFFGNLCRTKFLKTFSVIYAETINRKTFSVIYAETINRKTFSVIYAETINRKTFSVNILCVHCIIVFLSIIKEYLTIRYFRSTMYSLKGVSRF